MSRRYCESYWCWHQPLRDRHNGLSSWRLELLLTELGLLAHACGRSCQQRGVRPARQRCREKILLIWRLALFAWRLVADDTEGGEVVVVKGNAN